MARVFMSSTNRKDMIWTKQAIIVEVIETSGTITGATAFNAMAKDWSLAMA
jgi:RNase P/RNase MRP subunit POP5